MAKKHRSIDAQWLLPDMPTFSDVIDFYEINVAGNLSYGSYQKRWSDFLREKLGVVRMDELRRQQIWDALWERYDWPSVRDALAQTKRAFNYAVKAPKHCRVDGPPLNPILHPLENPLKGVVVNLKGSPSWKADRPSADLVAEMTTNSEQAWEAARTKKRAWEEEQRENGDPVVLQPPSQPALIGLALPVGAEPQECSIPVDPDAQFRWLQEFVGGSISIHRITASLVLTFNDNGLLLRLPYNRCGFVNNIVVRKVSSAGNTLSMNPKDLEAARDWLERNKCSPPVCHVCGDPGGLSMFCRCRDVLIFCVDCYRKVDGNRERFGQCGRCLEAVT